MLSALSWVRRSFTVHPAVENDLSDDVYWLLGYQAVHEPLVPVSYTAATCFPRIEEVQSACRPCCPGRHQPVKWYSFIVNKSV